MSIFTILIMSLMGGNASAEIRVSCRFSNCLSDGARVYNSETKTTGDVICDFGDCAKWGWVYREKNKDVSEAQCHGDCVRLGYTVYKAQSGERLYEVSCNGFGCMEDGFTTTYESGQRFESRCDFGDCGTWGWKTYDSSGKKVSQTQCFGQCLEGGWTTKYFKNSNAK